jgi:VanZ family protein
VFMDRILGISRILAAVCVGGIIVLSLLPGSYRPHTGASKLAEHFIAYAGTAFIFSILFNGVRQQWVVFAVLASMSCAMDLLQRYVPGRTPAILDVVASTAGVAAGLIVGAIVYLTAQRALRGTT